MSLLSSVPLCRTYVDRSVFEEEALLAEKRKNRRRRRSQATLLADQVNKAYSAIVVRLADHEINM